MLTNGQPKGQRKPPQPIPMPDDKQLPWRHRNRLTQQSATRRTSGGAHKTNEQKEYTR